MMTQFPVRTQWTKDNAPDREDEENEVEACVEPWQEVEVGHTDLEAPCIRHKLSRCLHLARDEEGAHLSVCRRDLGLCILFAGGVFPDLLSGSAHEGRKTLAAMAARVRAVARFLRLLMGIGNANALRDGKCCYSNWKEGAILIVPLEPFMPH